MRDSASIIEFRLGKWPPRFRLSIHSDKGGSRIGYGVFRGLMGHIEKQDPGVLLDPHVESKMIWRNLASVMAGRRRAWVDRFFMAVQDKYPVTTTALSSTLVPTGCGMPTPNRAAVRHRAPP